MVHASQQKPLYPRKNPPPSIAISRNGRVRTFEVRPLLAGLVVGSFGLSLAAYVGATAYLIYRDDLLGAAVSRQVEMQYAYEERIAALRSELDRVSSRHLIQTESVETQLGVLLERQADLQERQSALDGLVFRARTAGVALADAATRMPRARPIAAAENPDAALAYAPSAPAVDHMITGALLGGERASASGLGLRPLLADVHSGLEGADAQQSRVLDTLSAATEAETDRLTEALEPLGIEAGGSGPDQPQGGPFIPAAGLHFVERTAILQLMLDDVEALHRNAESMPIRAPLRSARISSRFGNRMDPFLRRPGFHAGLDLAAAEGSEVRSTAPGTVVSAGLEGGYGKMVEIRHADGLSTRYGHLSAILVPTGAHIPAGTPIGRVGSTGRSTGPHLHYETRRGGKAVNPAPFLAAGKALHQPEG